MTSASLGERIREGAGEAGSGRSPVGQWSGLAPLRLAVGPTGRGPSRRDFELSAYFGYDDPLVGEGYGPALAEDLRQLLESVRA